LDRPILVGVAGGTSAGKSTFAGRIAEAIGPERALIIAESSYYFDRSHFRVDFPEQVNFDHPDSIDLVCMESHLKDLIAGRAVPQFHYHRDTGVREETGKMVEPRQVIIVEGILILGGNLFVLPGEGEAHAPPLRDALEAVRRHHRAHGGAERSRFGDGGLSHSELSGMIAVDRGGHR